MRNPRPAPIVAAAVLLIVVAGELFLFALGCVSVELWWLLNGDRFEGVLTIFAFVALAVGVPFLVVAVRVLRGTLENTWLTGDRILGVGIIAAMPWLVFLCCCGIGLASDWQQRSGRIAKENLYLVAGLLFVWLNTAAVNVAGWLLRTHAGRYAKWRAARRPPEEIEDE